MNTPQTITIIAACLLIYIWTDVFIFSPFANTATVEDWLLPVLLLAVYMVGGVYFFNRFKTEL